MLRGLLLLFVCLAAGLPAHLCLCDHHDEPTEPHECACELHSREVIVPPAPAVEGDMAPSVAIHVEADLTPPPPVPHPAFRSESPPGGTFHSLPLYLSVARLLI